MKYGVFRAPSALLRAALLGSTAIVAASCGAAHAQDGAIVLDEITVEGQGDGGSADSVAGQGFAPNTAITGAKSDTPINEIPQTVNVITREELDIRGAEDFNSALAYTPAVRVTDYPGGQGSPTIGSVAKPDRSAEALRLSGSGAV